MNHKRERDIEEIQDLIIKLRNLYKISDTYISELLMKVRGLSGSEFNVGDLIEILETGKKLENKHAYKVGDKVIVAHSDDSQSPMDWGLFEVCSVLKETKILYSVQEINKDGTRGIKAGPFDAHNIRRATKAEIDGKRAMSKFEMEQRETFAETHARQERENWEHVRRQLENLSKINRYK